MKSVMILLANIFLPMLTTAASTTRYFDTTPTVPLREKDVFLSFDQLGQVRDKFEGLSKQLRRNHTIEVPKANQMLEQFVHLLKTFFSDTDFDRVGFAKQETNLRRKLSEITQYLGDNDKKSSSFVSSMLQIFSDCARYMGCYFRLNDTGNYCVHKMVEVYARAVALKTSRGCLDLNVENYASRVFGLYREAWGLHKKFDKLSDPPLHIRLMFFDHFFRTTRTLDGLIDQIPSINNKEV